MANYHYCNLYLPPARRHTEREDRNPPKTTLKTLLFYTQIPELMVYKGQRVLTKNRKGFRECGYYARAQCVSMKKPPASSRRRRQHQLNQSHSATSLFLRWSSYSSDEKEYYRGSNGGFYKLFSGEEMFSYHKCNEFIQHIYDG